MDLESIQTMVTEGARAKGWMEKEIPVPEMIALIHSEASEALECYRKSEPVLHYDSDGKPEGIASEFADIVIRVCHYASFLDIDINSVVIEKHNYNMTRPHRHGGKVC